MNGNNEQVIEMEEFYKNSLLTQPNKIPDRVEFKDGRWYHLDGKYKPSVTRVDSVIDKGYGFEKWLGDATSYKDACEYRDKRAEIGSKVHTLIAKLILYKQIKTDDLTEEEIKMVMSFKQFWIEKDPLPVTIECPLWSDTIPVAGTVDMIIRIDSENWIIDIKTGNIWNAHQIQLSWYKHLAEDMFNIKIDHIAAVRPKVFIKNPSCQIKEFEPLDRQFLDNVYELWEWNNNFPGPKEETKYPEIITLEDTDESK